jgi:hypothetical protein
MKTSAMESAGGCVKPAAMKTSAMKATAAKSTTVAAAVSATVMTMELHRANRRLGCHRGPAAGQRHGLGTRRSRQHRCGRH